MLEIHLMMHLAIGYRHGGDRTALWPHNVSRNVAGADKARSE